MKIIFSLYLMFGIAEIIQAKTVPLGKEAKFALDYHNKLRRSEKAANMMKMKWNRQLAREAQAWIKRCTYKHQYGGRGENLGFTDGERSLHTRVKHHLNSWYKEKKLHNWGAIRCSTSCHYTQVVWAKTSQVGCAMEYCSSLRGGTRKSYFFACFYHGPANMEKEVYKKGAPCSKCPKGSKCDNGLCDGGRAGADVTCGDTYKTKKCKRWADDKECNRNPTFMKAYCKKSCKLC